MIRWFWRIYLPVAALALLAVAALSLGPFIEPRFLPVRMNHSNHDAYRTSHEVCWMWSSDKLRFAFSDNVDVQLDLLGADGRVRNTFVPFLYNVRTGQPWQSGGVLGLSHSEIPYCIDLPRVVKPEDRIRVRFTPVCHGWLDLWPLPTPTPDMVFGPNSTGPERR